MACKDRAMYPPTEPSGSGLLDVGDGHLVYWEVVGSRDGRLVVLDDAGHFGGSMGEQFTAAIDAMADRLRPN